MTRHSKGENMIRAFILAALLTACTDSGKASRTLENAGFSDIELTGYRGWSCGEGDDTCTGFRARGPSGRIVTGAVGCGYWGKGCTIRFD